MSEEYARPIMFAHEEIKKIIALIGIIQAVGKEKISIELQRPGGVKECVYELEDGRIVKAISTKDKLERRERIKRSKTRSASA